MTSDTPRPARPARPAPPRPGSARLGLGVQPGALWAHRTAAAWTTRGPRGGRAPGAGELAAGDAGGGGARAGAERAVWGLLPPLLSPARLPPWLRAPGRAERDPRATPGCWKWEGGAEGGASYSRAPWATPSPQPDCDLPDPKPWRTQPSRLQNPSPPPGSRPPQRPLLPASSIAGRPPGFLRVKPALSWDEAHFWSFTV